MIKARFFEDLFRYTSEVFYHRFPAKTWRGHRLIGVDGTGLRIPNEWWLGEHFGWHQNQHHAVPSTRWLAFFDLLNQQLIDLRLHPRSMGESRMALPLVEQLEPDMVAIYDRGFGGYALPWMHRHHGSHCLIRLIKTFSPTVVEFLDSGAKEGIFTSALSSRALASIRACGIEIQTGTTLTYRLIRVDLPTGEPEVLMTTLLHRRRYHYTHFGTLYHLRWGVETAFFTLKSYFQAAVFSAYTLPAVEQDLWALFAMYNLQSMCIRAAEKQLQKINEQRYYEYQINRNVGIGLIKRFVHPCFLDEIKNWNARLNILLQELLKHLEPKRPHLRKPRQKKLMRGTERHYYEANYKPTL